MIALEVVLSVLSWIWEHGRAVFLGLALLFMGLWGKGCATSNALSLELEACRKAPPTTATATAATATRTITQVRVVYKDGSPCPDVALDTDSQNATTGTATASIPPQKCPSLPFYGLQIGGGYLGTPYASLGLSAGPWTLSGQAGLGPVWGGGLTYRAVSW